MRKNCRSLLLASLALTCGLLASCLSSGPEKPLGAMADAMEKNDSAAFLAQMDMPLFAANEARNMTNENEALNMLTTTVLACNCPKIVVWTSCWAAP